MAIEFPITFSGLEPKLDREHPHLFPAHLASTAGVLQGGADDAARRVFMKQLTLRGASVDDHMLKHVTEIRNNPAGNLIMATDASVTAASSL